MVVPPISVLLVGGASLVCHEVSTTTRYRDCVKTAGLLMNTGVTNRFQNVIWSGGRICIAAANSARLFVRYAEAG